MVFKLNERGNIDSLPLFNWQTAVIGDVACLLRLELARHADEPETNPLVVQLTLGPEQASELAQELQKMAKMIEDARRSTSAH